MGAGASSGLGEKVQSASVDDLRSAFASLPADQQAKLAELVNAEGASEPPPVQLSFVVDQLFRCFDADQDGQIEREEYLDCHDKIATILDESFGPKQRKVKMQWFKDAGAEKIDDGMYLSREKWEAAFLATAATDSGIPADQEPKLASWLWKTYAQQLVYTFFPGEKPAEPAKDADASSGPKPEYPMTIPLTDLGKRLDEAKDWGLRPLILGNGLSEIDTFFKYRQPDNLTVEASQLFNMKKEEKKAILKRGMEHMGLCAPVLLKLGKADSDIKKSCCDEFPADIFNSEMWTYKAAHEQEFITDAMKEKLDIDPGKWKDFMVITYSELGLDDAKAKLSDKLPHFEKFAMIVVDPASVA